LHAFLPRTGARALVNLGLLSDEALSILAREAELALDLVGDATGPLTVIRAELRCLLAAIQAQCVHNAHAVADPYQTLHFGTTTHDHSATAPLVLVRHEEHA